VDSGAEVKNPVAWPLLSTMAVLVAACGQAAAPAGNQDESNALVGAWRSRISFSSGAFAPMKDLEFMYVMNAGGTLTESSNYDGAPPVPPAYGVWRKSGPQQFEFKYAFYVTKAPVAFDDIAKGGGWAPDGHGVFTEKISLSEDGKSYKSTILYAAFDKDGKPVDGGGEGTGVGVRMGF
jgi:hypothetical protein